MLSILVCHSYFLRFDQKQMERAKPYPPLATLQVAALLRQQGHAVTLFDSMLAEGLDEYTRQLADAQPQLVLLYEDNFNFLSKMCLGKMRQAACQMIAAAHRAGARVIAAGPDVTDAPEPYLRAGADFALSGEGLTALLELVPRIEGQLGVPLSGSPPSANGRSHDLVVGLPGVATLRGDKVTITKGARVFSSVEHDSLPAWDLLDIERYRSVWMRAHRYFSLNMAASRGCSFRCSWCAKPIWGNQYLQRDATAVAHEMAHLKRTLRPDHVWFADDIFGFRVDWVAKFAAAARELDGQVPFTVQTRADLISERMAQALSAAGCREAWIGAESGSQRVLDAMNKGTTVEEIRTARTRLQAVGIRVGFFIQLGYLDEQLEDILATRELLEDSRPDDVGVSVSYPLPGTRFYEHVKEQMRGKTHWQESNDLDMMFQGTYTSEFYRAIRDLLHQQVALNAPGSSQASRSQHAIQRSLERRWQELVSRELQYRSCSSARPVAAV